MWECRNCNYKGKRFKYSLIDIDFRDTTKVFSGGIKTIEPRLSVRCPECSAMALVPITKDGKINTRKKGIANDIQ